MFVCECRTSDDFVSVRSCCAEARSVVKIPNRIPRQRILHPNQRPTNSSPASPLLLYGPLTTVLICYFAVSGTIMEKLTGGLHRIDRMRNVLNNEDVLLVGDRRGCYFQRGEQGEPVGHLNADRERY